MVQQLKLNMQKSLINIYSLSKSHDDSGSGFHNTMLAGADTDRPDDEAKLSKLDPSPEIIIPKPVPGEHG